MERSEARMVVIFVLCLIIWAAGFFVHWSLAVALVAAWFLTGVLAGD